MSKKQVSFHIARILELEFAYKSHLEIPEFSDGRIPENLSAGLNIKYSWSLEKNVFAIQVSLMFAVDRSESERFEFLKHVSIAEFAVDDLKNITKVQNKDHIQLEKNWEITFVSLAVSTARGMLASKTAGTFYNTLVFPIVDPTKVIISELMPDKQKNHK